ncbi:MAG: helix-turn-helix domain-containing protein [Rhodospirillales bacterium]|nr:helix-turn-helix domain-containing protein [Rhodospirillales bacterium]
MVRELGYLPCVSTVAPTPSSNAAVAARTRMVGELGLFQGVSTAATTRGHGVPGTGRRVVIERLLTARELADVLGISADTALDWFEAGKLPGFKLNGRAVRFRWSEVERWLEAQRPAARAVHRHLELL